ncbi:DUF58 domain-containing protein [Thalassospira sp. TSL5-1]|uniref:DUF58 domain-containing protein n=1 Tax=Thalassospira sp. TSL5-1 TaxID=1544451 RepID=UPI00093FEBE2|nr:DUF58 domain-containing protein [Thalassospira sp. TSL5-1]OKH88745.1 hypothetical protein LF95_01175 [Thalassospira sp. TSL5-1]
MVPARNLPDQIAAARSLAARLPQLIDESRRLATALRSGLHGNRKVGPGSDFWQFRPYVPGDPTGQIDWRRSARSDHTFIRQTEWQASHTYWIWPIFSGSAFWSSTEKLPPKADRMMVMALALADLLLRNGETVGTFDAPHTRITVHEQLEKLGHAMLNAPANADQGITAIHPGRRHSVLILGDFLEYAAPDHSPVAELRRLAHNQNDGALLQVLDPAECVADFTGRIDFVDADDSLVLHSEKFEDQHAEFAKRSAHWRARIRDAATLNQWLYDLHVTTSSPSQALMALYQHMTERADPNGSNGASPAGRGQPT